MKKFPSRESGRLMARALKRLQIRRATLFTTLFAVLISTFTFVNQSPVRAATVGSGACVQTVDSNVGVSVTQVGNECIVTFVSGTNNNWTVPARVTSVRALVVGGGGGGGAWVGGGGGGGGFRDINPLTVTPGNTVAVSVGAGGTPANVSGGVYSGVVGTNGGESKFGTLLAAGGGKGGSHDPNGGDYFATLKPFSGGSGGGGTGRGSYSAQSNYGTLSTGASGNTPSTSPSQGNTGGDGYAGGVWVAAGGGGAGGVGGNATSTTGGAGGPGASSDITGSVVFYAGGGGGIVFSSTTGAGAGGSGGGGNGTANGTGVSGTANTGGGGGGGGTNSNTSRGGSGGSGIVVIRYTIVESAGSGSCQQFFSKSGSGTLTTVESNNFCYLAFRNTGTIGTQTAFTLQKPSLATSFEYLVVGGGGGGALRHGGGGGAGGLVKGTLNISSLSTISLSVGGGGAGRVIGGGPNYGPGATGADSILESVVAKGGGGGNTGGGSTEKGLTGGSGGGALAVGGGGAVHTAGQGNVGAGGVGGVSPYPSGGGGGAGGAGTAGSGTTAGAGGSGAIWDAGFTKTIAQNLGWSSTSAQFTGDQVFFAGGGGGGLAGGTAGTASAGGGAGSATSNGVAGLADSGGGGGGSGCCTDAPGGNGGSGIVIIRYALASQSALSVTSTSGILGTTLSLTTSGGSGNGAVSYAVTSAGTAGCSVSGSTLSYSSAGTCSVTATKASADGYASTSSSATEITVSGYTITYSAGTGATGSNQVANKTHGINLTLAKGASANSWFTKSGSYVIGWSTSNGGSLTHQLGASYTTNAALTLYPVWSANYFANLTSTVPGSAGTTGKTYRVQSTLVPNKTSFTLEGWFFDKPTATGQNPIYSQGKTNNNSFAVMTGGSTDSRTFSALFSDQWVNITGVARGTWHHFAVTRQGLNYVIYIDGVQRASGTLSSDSYVDDASTYSFFGENAYYQTPGKHVYHGYLDQIKIWNGPLTSSQVLTSMHGYGASGISSPSLTNLYDFNDQSQTTARDQVGSINLTVDGSGTLAFSEFTIANTFDSNGGSSVSSANFHNHNLVSEPTAPTRANYAFNGWTTTLNDISTLVTFPYAPWPFAAETLYANWSPGVYRVTYNYDSATGGNSNATADFTFGGSALVLPTPTKTNFNFAGWYSDSAKTVFVGAGGASYSPTSAITLYANWTPKQLVDSSLELSGTAGQYGQISDGQILPATTAFTLETWLKPAADVSSNGNAVLISQGTGGGRFYIKRSSTGSMIFARDAASAEATCGNAPANTWNHIAITYNGSGTSTCFLNGVQQSTLSASASIGTKFVVGDYSASLGFQLNTWKGSIDEVRVYNTARTSTQIAADAHAYATITDSSLIAYYDFNEGTGTTGFNQKYGASSATNLTLSGSPTFADVAESSIANGRSVKIFKRSYLNNTGGWSTPAEVTSANALVVGGGGGGAGSLTTRTMDGTGGGGGGGAYLASGYPVSGVIPIVVGFGGSGGAQGSTSAGREGNRGGTSSFGSVSAGGGGGGGCSSSTGNSSAGNLIPCAAGTQQHGGSGTAGGGGGGATNFLLAYNFGSGGTGSDATVGSVTFTGQVGFRGGYFNDGGTSSTGDGSPGGGARIAANRNTIGSGLSSSITGTNTEYGRGGTARGVTGYTYSAQAAGFGTGGSGSYSASGPATNGGNGAAGVVVLSYGLENQAALTVTSTAGTTGSTLALTTSGGSGSGTVTFTATTGTAGCSVSGSTLSFTSTGTCEVTATKAAADGFSAVSSSATTITVTAGTYTVTYNYNNATGGNSTTTSSFTVGGSAISLPTPTRTGFGFDGWFEASNLSGSALGTTYSPTQSRTLYAKWTANTYTVTYNYNNATGGNTTATSSFTVDGTAITLPTPTRTGYGFDGWFEASNLSGSALGTNYSPTQSRTLYAKWTANPQNITYAPGTGGTGNGPTSPATVLYDASFTTPANTYNRTGYTFAGWSDGSAVFAAAARYPATGVVTAPVTLTATWTANPQNITYAAGTGGAGNGPTSPATVLYDASFTTPANTFNRNGYTFAGWSDGSSVFAAGSRYPTTGVVTAPVTLTATWTLNSQNITYAPGSGGTGTGPTTPATVSFGSTFTTPANTYLRDGFSFAGWSDGTTVFAAGATYPTTGSISADVTLTATWTGNKYSYNANTGSNPPANQTYAGSDLTAAVGTSVNAPTGYSFGGWCTTQPAVGATCGGVNYLAGATLPIPSSATVTLFATWTAIPQNITYAAGTGGTGNGPTSPATVLYDASFTTPANTFNKTGYTFAGWSDGSATYAAGARYPATGVVTAPVTLTATWTANPQNITYAPGTGGTGNGPTSPATVLYDASFTTPANTYNRTGYTFAGWSDGSTVFAAGARYPATGVVTSPVTLTATWTANPQNITYAAGTGGTGTSPTSPATVLYDSFFTTPANTFTKAGYAFMGWSDGNSIFAEGARYPASGVVTAPVTLTATWEGNANTVTYNSKGGSPVANGSFISGGSIQSAPTDPTRTGYIFAGWSATDGGTAITFPYSPTATANITLFARWTEITYTLTYNRNGATGSPERATDTYSYTGGVELSGRGTMELTGYSFAGWAESIGGAEITGTYVPTSNKTLYARWVARSYTLTYFSNSGGTPPNVDSYTSGTTALTLPTQGSMTRAGYTFNGWSTTINDVTTKIANSHSSATLTTAAPVNLFALWTANPYEVAYTTQDAGSGTAPTDATIYNIGNSIIVKANTGAANSVPLTRTGYTFAGWTDNLNGTGTVYKSGDIYTVGSTDVTFYPKWTANTYTITYNVNGASGSPVRATDTYTTGNPAVTLAGVGTMTKFGYTFAGWSADPLGSGQTSATTVADVTLYAIWTVKSIQYTYRLGTVNSNPVNENFMSLVPSPLVGNSPYNSSTTLSSNIDPTYVTGGSTYQFFGWRDNIYGHTYNPGSSYLIQTESSVEFAAQWVQILEVRYAFNGGTGSPGNTAGEAECAQVGNTCFAGQPITLNTAPTRTGYTFTGWKDQNGADFVAGTTTTVTSTSFLFYAQWQAIPYTMSFDSNGGETANASQITNIGQSFTFPDPGARAGYTFNGWIRGDIQNSPTYGIGTSFVTGSSSVPFIASWTPRTYTVTYNWNGGVGSPTSPADYTVGQTAITLPAGTNTRDGYVFDGWQVSGTTTKLTSPFAPTANSLLEARWLDGAYTITYNNFNGTANTTASVTRATTLALPTPTRAGFSFAGWYQDAGYTMVYGAGGEVVTPIATTTIFAKWVQNSLVGINPAHLNSLVELTMVANSASNWTGSHGQSGTAAELDIPANALPAGTKVKVSFVEDLTRPANLIDGSNAYFTSVVVHWLTGTGASATVPDAASGSPLTLTLTNPEIVAGAKVFKILNGVVTEVATATEDGEVTITFTQDPEFVVAATRPGSPTAATATNNLNAQSTVSWRAPLGNGGSSITGYTVTASPGSATCATTGTSCLFTGLTNGTSYTFTVKATNAIGDSAASSPSSAITPRLAFTYNATFNSAGGSTVAASSFIENGTLSAPTDPTRNGFNFIGWSTQNGVEASIVSFPYTPSNADLTLYAIWRASNPSNGGSGNQTPAPTAKPTTKSTPKPSATASSTAEPAPTATESISPAPTTTSDPTKPTSPTSPGGAGAPVEPTESSDSNGLSAGALGLLALLAAAAIGYAIRRSLRKP